MNQNETTFNTAQLLQPLEELSEERKAFAFSELCDFFKKLLSALKISSPAPAGEQVWKFHAE